MKHPLASIAPNEEDLAADDFTLRISEHSDENGITAAERLHRISIAILPLRCFFDGKQKISFRNLYFCIILFAGSPVY